MKLEQIEILVEKFEDKLAPIKVLLFDIDGILTDGKVYYHGEEVGFNRFFHALDGYGMKLMKNAGFKVGLISGGDSVGIHKRAEYLKLDYIFVGNQDKREAWKKVLDDGYKNSEILFMGDELFDIPLLKVAGFSATVPNSSYEVKASCDYVTVREGGDGAVREVIDILRFAKKIKVKIPEFE